MKTENASTIASDGMPIPLAQAVGRQEGTGAQVGKVRGLDAKVASLGSTTFIYLEKLCKGATKWKT
jgi:hypothetical protein